MKTLCYTNKRKGAPPLLKQAKFYIEECTKGVIKPQKNDHANYSAWSVD